MRNRPTSVYEDLVRRSAKGALALLLEFIDWQKIADAEDAELLRVPEIGRKRMVFIRSILAFHGYTPKPVEPQFEKVTRAQLLQIITDLFAEHEGHADGCLSKRNGPCQCGWSTTQVRYNFALSAARKLAAAHDYSKDFREPIYVEDLSVWEKHARISKELDAIKEGEADAD